MLTMEYSYEKDMQVKQEEARAEGREEGEIAKARETAVNMNKKGYPITIIADLLEIGVNTIKEWLSE